jgi:hypothetical protein
MTELLQLLEGSPSLEEMKALDQFIRMNSRKYEFGEPWHAELLQKMLFVRVMIEYSLQSDFVLSVEFYPYVLKVLQVIRILTRDTLMHEVLKDSLPQLERMLKTYAHAHFEDFHAASVSEMLVELVSTVRRLAANPSCTGSLETSDLPQLMTALLGSTHSIVTRSALEALMAMIDKPSLLSCLETTSVVELALRIVNDYEGEYVILAASLLTQVCKDGEMSRQVRVQRGTLTVFT